MFENVQNTDDDRGQVGIGTLIVFIALVLVAAIAAGVLINTAGFLQSQAESTGQESTNQVTNNLNVEAATGAVKDGGGTVETVNITVSLAPGADPIDMSDVQIEYLGDSVSTTTGTTTGVAFYNASGTELTTASQKKIEGGDRVIINMDLSAFPGTELDEGDEAEVKIVSPSGASTTEILNAPDPLTDSQEGVFL
jgi:flagellin FlaB